MESVEEVSSLVARYTELEARILLRTSVMTKQLSAALVKLYIAILDFLVQARLYYRQRTISQSFICSIALLTDFTPSQDSQKCCSTCQKHH